MFTKIIFLLSLSVHALSGGLRNPMTTVIPKSNVVVNHKPNEFSTYQSQPKSNSLYYHNNTLN